MTARALAALMALALSACGVVEASAPTVPDLQAERVQPAPTTTTTATTEPPEPAALAPPTTTSTVPARRCVPQPLGGDLRSDGDPRIVSLELSRAVHPCADLLVLADPDPARMRDAARVATSEGGALLITDARPTPEQLSEVERLAPETIVSFGVEIGPGPWHLHRQEADPGAQPPPLPSAGDDVWLIRSTEAGVVAAAAAAVGAAVIESTVADPRALPGEEKARLATAGSVRLVGAHSDSARWQVGVARRGLEIPGGGQLMFPGRRLLALYGSPRSASLGVLGETGPAGALETLLEMAPAYEADGVTVLPTFELIATVAAGEAGGDGDFSEETPVEDLRPWVEAAAEHGAYVVLDLQPGRSDFLTQARRYEELLRLPHVGLALDPEWRLDDHEEHLDQIGSVTGAEINQVVGWLAELVRAERLPQKLLVIHQFKLRMITDRETIRTPSELAVVIHMDGQGPLATKFATYRALVAGTEDRGWWWGWKSFFDEDDPMATPDQVLGVDPPPVFVSFQ